MTKILRKIIFLTSLASFLVISQANSSILKQLPNKNYLRWNISTKKNHLYIDKKDNLVSIKTLNGEVFGELSKEAQNLNFDKRYIKEIIVKRPNEKNNVSSIDIVLADKNIEMFNFYKDRDKLYTIDFWVDADSINAKEAAIQKKVGIQGNLKSKAVKNKPSITFTKKREKKKIILPQTKSRTKIVKNDGYRDFRYGIPFIWKYEPYIPEAKAALKLDRKTPEYFYPIKDREYTKSDQEAHLQLCINLYRKKKWGLMYKAMTLYGQKYGEHANIDFIEYIKGNALIRSNLDKGITEPVKMAVSIFRNISQRSKKYELRKASLKYLITYYVSVNENVEALALSKKFYVDSKENFDYEEATYAVESMLFNMSKLNQIDQIKELIKDKTLTKVVSGQVIKAYQIYTELKLGNYKEVLKIYNKNKKSFSKPVHGTILFNVAETYFRMSEFDKAISLFDEFLDHYSYTTISTKARLRVALAYEISEKDIRQTENLYLNAINRGQDPETVAEAKLRYVALRNLRKKNIDSKDRELRVFVENLDKSHFSNRNMLNSKWVYRLREFIVDNELKKALSYLNAIPLESLKKTEKRIFESDGSEIVFHMINDSYQAGNYPEVIKVWELYKDRYIDKVALDSSLNFIVAKSYLKLGFMNRFQEIYTSFNNLKDTPERTYPIWKHGKILNYKSKEFLAELNIEKSILQKNWKEANEGLEKYKEISQKNLKYYYYAGMISFYQKDYKNAEKRLEDFLTNDKKQSLYDTSELAALIDAYATSVYENNNLEKFKDIANALLKDTEKANSENKLMKLTRERLSYLYIEILAGEGTKSSVQLVSRIKSFLNEFEKSNFKDRINYLHAKNLISQKKEGEGMKILNNLLNDTNVSDYIKELVRAEISLLNLKKRTI